MPGQGFQHLGAFQLILMDHELIQEYVAGKSKNAFPENQIEREESHFRFYYRPNRPC